MSLSVTSLQLYCPSSEFIAFYTSLYCTDYTALNCTVSQTSLQVQSSAEKCMAVQSSAEQCRKVQNSAEQYKPELWRLFSAVLCSRAV